MRPGRVGVLAVAVVGVTAALLVGQAVADPSPESPDPAPSTSPSASESPSASPSASPSPTTSGSDKTGTDKAVAATTITVTPTAHSLPAGERRTFSGVVSNGGTPLAGVKVTVVQKAGTAWKTVATLTTDAAGGWSYAVGPVAATTWRTDFAGDATNPAAKSAEYSASIVQEPSAARVASANAWIAGRNTWASWALFDQLTGRWYYDPRVAQVNNTESMIKVWVAADLLRAVQQQGRTTLSAYEHSLISRMIRNSDDQATETVYRARGGNAVIQRMISICKLTDTYIGKTNRWSWTKMSSGTRSSWGCASCRAATCGRRWATTSSTRCARCRRRTRSASSRPTRPATASGSR